MEEFKRIPFGGNPYADFEFFKVELKVCDVEIHSRADLCTL